MTYEQYKRKRNKVSRSKVVTNKKTIKSGRVVHNFHICGLCGRPLCKVVPKTGAIVVSVTHYYLNYPSFVHTSLCKDAKSCYYSYINRGK